MPSGFPAIEEDRIGHRFLAEEDVIGDGQDGHEHEVLVDHADSAVDGISRVTDDDGLAAHTDLALVRCGQPIEDVHEGGFARAVFAEQRMDLAGAQVEIDAVVGGDARIALDDAAHLERQGRGVLGHCSGSAIKSVIGLSMDRGGPFRRPAPVSSLLGQPSG